MVFDLLGAILTGGVLFAKAGDIGNNTAINRKRARENGDIWYYDGQNKRRSTETNEILTFQYRDGGKIVGVKTGRVYQDIAWERTEKFIKTENAKLESKNSPVYYKRCPRYWDSKNKSYMDVHLYERSTGKPYQILMKYANKKVNGMNLLDRAHFVIAYLDENNGMKYLGEYKTISNKYYYDYLFGYRG